MQFLSKLLISAIISFTLSCNAFASARDAFEALESHWSEEHDGKVLRQLQAQGLVPQSVSSKKASTTECGRDFGLNGSRALRIQFIEAEGKEYVVKLTSDEHEYAREVALLESGAIEGYKKTLSDYTAKSGQKTSHLTSYYGCQKFEGLYEDTLFVTIVEKAPGKTLADLSEQRIDSKALPLTEEEMAKMGSNIGQQLGATTRAFFEKDQTILAHGDIGGQNFLYDPLSEQFSWIDLGGTETRHISEKEAGDFSVYYEIECSMFKTVLWPFFDNYLGNAYKSNSTYIEGDWVTLEKAVRLQGVEALTKHKGALAYGKALYEGYKGALAGLESKRKLTVAEGEDPYSLFDGIYALTLNNYMTAFEGAFEEDAALKRKVTEYLFPKPKPLAEALPDSPKPLEVAEVEDAEESLREKAVLGGLAELKKGGSGSMGKGDLEIYSALRRADSRYNSYGLEDRRNYSTNLDLLEKEYVKRRLKEVTDKYVDTYLTRERLQLSQAQITQVKEQVAEEARSKLIRSNRSALELAKQHRIGRV